MVKGLDLHPEIPQESRSQYRITDEHLGEGTEKENIRIDLCSGIGKESIVWQADRT